MIKHKLRRLRELAKNNPDVDARAAEDVLKSIRRMRKAGLRRRLSEAVRPFASTRLTRTN
jgi:hypothetical protein